MTTKDSLFLKIESYRDEMIAMQKELIALPAFSPESGGDGEGKKAEYLTPLIKEVFDHVELFKEPDDRTSCGYRPNIVATINGKDNNTTIWFMSHLDVVPPGDASLWDTPPFEAVVKDGKIFGRGAEDNHQGIISTFFAVKALKEEGIVPACKIGCLFVADEETEEPYGVEYLVQNHPELFGKNDLVIVPDGGNEDGSEIMVAEKSLLWLKFTVAGKQAHGSTPAKGINAHRAGAHLITLLNALYIDFPESEDTFEPPTSTFEPTMKEANVQNINTIPGTDIFYYDCRILPSISCDTVLGKIGEYAHQVEKEYGVSIEVTAEARNDAAPPTPIDSPLVAKLSHAAEELYGVSPRVIGVGGGTVASYFRRIGLHAAVYSRLVETQHQPNEYCLIDNIIGDAKIWAHVMTN
jgi:succinyl-diaminopimelate desuccinylase